MSVIPVPTLQPYHQRALDLIAWAFNLRSQGGWAKQTRDSAPQPVRGPIDAVGNGTRYDCGPGKTYPTPDTIPWAGLVAGDAVNIWANTNNASWKYHFGIVGLGTANAPIIINGVTDAQGVRPIFDMKNSRTCAGCSPGGADNIFSDTQWSLDKYGCIVITRKPADDYYSPKPSFIQLRNLEITGGKNGNKFTDHAGNQITIDDGAGIWAQYVDDLRIINCDIHGNNFNLFTMAKDDALSQACEHVYFIGSRCYDGGSTVPGRDDHDHGIYMQCAYPAVFGSFVGENTDGSIGSSMKDRSCMLIYFDNDEISSAGRSLDLVHSEGQQGIPTGPHAEPGIAILPGYGIDYVFGNTRDRKHTKNALHYGADNGLQQNSGNGPPLDVGEDHPRRQCYYWANADTMHMTQAELWRTIIFSVSLINTTIIEWGNTWNLTGDTLWCWVESAGTVECHSPLPAGLTVQDDYDAGNGHATITHDTTPLTVPTGDVFLDALMQLDLTGSGTPPAPENQPPVSAFTFDAQDLLVEFRDASTDADGSITSRAWDFGDGATSTATNPAHTYADAGSYNVTLTVSDDDGELNTVMHVVTVTAAGEPPAPPPGDDAGVTISDTRVAKFFVSGSTQGHNELKEAQEEATNAALAHIGTEYSVHVGTDADHLSIPIYTFLVHRN